jgi:hypothetical protein
MKSNTFVIITLAIFLGLTSCKKDETATPAQSQPIEKVRCEQGVLTFSDNTSLNETIEMLSRMTLSEVVQWEDGFGFRSQSTLFRKMMDAEEQNEQLLYSGLDHDLTREQLAALGYPYSPTADYLNLERSGLVEEVVEADGNHHKQLTMKNLAIAFVVNADGLVRVGEFTFKYNPNSLVITGQNGKVVHEENEGQRALSDNWSNTSNWYNDPYYSSGRRVKTTINGSSSSSGNSLCNVIYNYSVEAESLLFGSWAKRNTYNPIYSASGSWSYKYELYNSGIFSNNLNSGSGLPSGFGYTVGSSNFLVLTLKPSGLWSLTSDTWVESVNMTSSSYNASFSGGSNGWSLSRISSTAAQQTSGTGMNGWVFNP